MTRRIYNGAHYTAWSMSDGSLIVTSKRTERGMRLCGDNTASWIDAIRTASDDAEAGMLCQRLVSAAVDEPVLT